MIEGTTSREKDRTRNLRGKALLTTQGKVPTKKQLIIKYRLNSPQLKAFEIAEKLKTSPNYVWKVLSEARKPSKVIRGRRGRIFAHGKVFYENWVSQVWLSSLKAPVVNPRTDMKQLGFKSRGDPCSCQIHPNGHLVIWPRSSGWRDWLIEELSICGWSQENAKLVAYHSSLNVTVVEGGVKPGDPDFLPKDLYLETEWGAVLVRDDSPERGVLELKLSIPDMRRYLEIPEIKKRLEVLEQGSLTVAQRLRAIEAILFGIFKILQRDVSPVATDGEK